MLGRVVGIFRRWTATHRPASAGGGSGAAAEPLEARRLLSLNLPGDFDNNDRFDAADINAISAAVRQGSADLRFDLNGDGSVTAADRQTLLNEILNATPDADLDGDTDLSDFAPLAANFNATPVGWAEGDYDGDARAAISDFALLASVFGARQVGGPVLANRAAQVAVAFSQVRATIDDWAARLDLIPPAGQPTAIPVAQDDLATRFGLPALLPGQVPSIERVSGVPAQLASILSGVGLQVVTLPATAGQVDVEVRLARDTPGLISSAAFDDATNPLLNGLSAALNLDGSIAHTLGVNLDLNIGADSGGFYLLGQGRITATLSAVGAVGDTYAIPFAALSLALSGSAEAEVTAALAAGTAGQRLRAAQLPGAFAAADVDGSATVDLGLLLSRGASDDRLAFDGSWTIPVQNGVIGPVGGALTLPEVDPFVEFVLPALSEGVVHFLPASLRDLLNNIQIPGVAGIPLAADAFRGRAGGSGGGLFDRLFDQVVATNDFTDISDRRGKGVTDADRILRALELRDLTNATGAGIKIGVISDGVAGLPDAVASGDLPDYLVGPSSQTFVNPATANFNPDGTARAEGTAMLEIIHDMAPGATLFFSGGKLLNPGGLTAPQQFMAAVEFLLDAGCDIIVDDLEYPATEGRLIDGEVASFVQGKIDAFAGNDPRDLLFVTAAGNHDKHVHADVFRPTTATIDGASRRVHLFDAPGLPSTATPTIVPPSGDALITLEWNRDLPAGTTLQLLLLDSATLDVIDTSTPVAGFERRQETLILTGATGVNFGFLGSYRIAVEATGASPLPELLRFNILFDRSEHPVGSTRGDNVLGPYGKPAGGPFGHSALTGGMLSVGAADEGSIVGDALPSQLAAYSVRGPALVNFQSRQVPHLVGVDGNDVTGAGPFGTPFDGTSSTAPQAAAVAALLKQLFPTTDFEVISQSMMQSARGIAGGTGGVWNADSGFGLMDAVAAAQLLGRTGHGPTLQAPENITGPRGLQLLAVRGFTIVDPVTLGEIASLIAGVPPAGDLLAVRYNPTLPPIAGSATFNPVNVGLPGVDVSFGGSVDASLTPALDLLLGVDAQGFFLGRSSTLGGTLSVGGEVAGRVGSIGVLAQPVVTLPLAVGYAPVSTNAKLRLTDAFNPANLSVSLGTVSANLTVDLQLNELDYVDNNPTVPNGPRGGDPFVFRATAGLQAAVNNGFDLSFTFTGIDVINPTFNGGNYTFGNFLTNLYRYGEDQLSGNGYLGRLLDALEELVQPLSDEFSIGDAIDEELIDLVLGASNVQILTPTSDVAFFNDLEAWLAGGGSTNFEIIRARATITDLDLVELLTITGDLGELLRDGNRPINLSDALLNGAIEFGIDTSGGLFVDRGGRTNLAVSLRVDADLDDQRLLGPFGAGDFLELDPGSSLHTTTVARVVLGGSGKLRIGDFASPIGGVSTSLDPVVVTLTIPGADLLPRPASGGFAGRVNDIAGTAVFSGATLDQLTLSAGSSQWDLFNAQVRLTGTAGQFNWDPQGSASQTLLTLTGLAVTFPGRPTWPTGTLASLVLTGQAITLTNFTVSSPSFNATPILEIRDPTFTLTNATIPITPSAVTVSGALSVGASGVALFPNTSTPALDGLVTVQGPTITLDANGLRVSALGAGFAVGDLVQITASGTVADPIVINPDATGAAPVLSLPSVSVAVPKLAIDGRTPQLTIAPLALRGDGRWDVGAVTFGFSGGTAATFGLGGLVPFQVNSIRLAFDTLPGGGANLDAFSVFLAGDVDEARLAALLAPIFGPNVAPTVSITAPGVRGGGSDVELKVVVSSLSQGRVGVQVNSVEVALANARIGVLDFEGRLGITFSPTTGFPTSVAGGLGFVLGGSSLVDPISDAQAAGFDANQQGGNASIGGLTLNDGNLNFTGSVNTANGTTFDLAVTTSLGIRLKLADFFELYGLNFGFDFDVSAGPAGGAFNPTVTGGLRTMGVRKVRASLGEAGNPLVQFTGGTPSADFVTLNFGNSGDIATFGPMSITLPGLGGLGGTVTDLRILRTGFPNLLPTPLAPSAQFVFTPGNIVAFFDADPDGPGGPQLSTSEKLFSWIPVRVDALGFQLQPAMFTFDGEGNISGINDLAAFDFVFSGGLKDEIKVNGVTVPFPLRAQITDLKLDIAALRDLLLDPTSGRSPFKDIGGVSIGVDPFAFAPDSPFKVKGAIGFGQIDTDNNGTRETLFIRVGGEFRYADFGGGAEVIISNRGPLLAKVTVPLAIPLGPTGLMVSGVSGGVAFGIDTFFTPSDPMELVRNPVFVNAFDVSDEGVRQALAILPPGQMTWNRGLTVQLQGQLSTVVPGVVSGAVSLLANVSVNAASTEAFLFGSGQVSVWGMPLGLAGVLLSLGDPLNPRYQFAMEAPAVGNPLGFILPTRGEFAFDLNPQGVLEAPLTMLDAFANSLSAAELNTMAQRLEADRVRNLPVAVNPLNGTLDFSARLKDLTRFVLDASGDGTVSAAEFATPITGTLLKNRVRALLPDDFTQLPTGPALVGAARLATTFVNDYINIVLGPQGNPAAAFAAFIDNVSGAVNAAIIAGWNGFNPTLTVRGLIQPTVFGFPLGNPTAAVTVSVNKTAITFDIAASLTKIGKDILSNSTLGVGGALGTLFTLGLEDNLAYGFRLDLSPISTLITRGLATGKTQNNVPFLDLLTDAINPFANWEVRLSGGISWLGFQLAQVDGLMFGADLARPGWNPALPVSATNHPDPKPGSLFEQLVRYFNRSISSNDLAAANDDPLHIPIYGNAPANEPWRDPRWTGMLREGGILISARLFLPSLLTDPVAVFNSIKWDQIPQVNGGNLPQTAEQFIAWIDDTVRKLTADDEFARLQMFIPSPARLFDLTTYQSNRPWLSSYSGDQSITKVNGSFVQETFTDTNGNGRYDFGEPFVDRPNGVFDPGESFTDRGNGRWDSAEPFTDANGNGVFNSGEAFTDLNRNGVWDPAEPKVVNSSGVITSFTDRGNGVWDDAEPFNDANGNGAFDPGERFDDFNNNGVRDLAEPFVDRGNGTYDGPSGTSPSRLPRQSQAGIDAVIGQIIGAAFVDGYLELELLGFDLGRAALSFDAQGISLIAEAGWLGAQLTATVRNTSHDLHDLINELTNSPLLSVALNNLPGLQTALSAPWLPDFDLPIPVAGFQITLDSNRAATFIADNLKINPSMLLSIGQVNAIAGIFTPGFAAAGTPPAGMAPELHAVQVDGGIYAQLKANFPGFLEDAELKLAVKIPRPPTGPANLIGAALPDFTASATASRFAASLAGVTLVKLTGTSPLDPFGFTVSKQGTQFAANLNGRIELLPDVSDFALSVVGAVTANFGLANPKYAASLLLSAVGGADFSIPAIQFLLPRLNTTYRLIVDSAAAKPVVLFVDGELRAGNLFVDGQFNLSVDSATASLAADASVVVRATAGTGTGAPNLISLSGNAGLRLAPNGFAARGTMTFQGGAASSLGFSFGFASNALFEINTFAANQTINGVQILAGRRRVAFDTDLQLGLFGFQAGASITVDPAQATLTLTAATENLPVFGTFSFGGSLTVAPGGIETGSPGILLSRTPVPGELFGLSGTFRLFVDTLDDPATPGDDPDVFEIAVSSPTLSMLGLSLSLPTVRITGQSGPAGPLFTLTIQDSETGENPLAGLGIGFPSLSFTYRVILDSAGQIRIDGGSNATYATATFTGWSAGDANVAQVTLSSVGIQVVRTGAGQPLRGRLRGSGLLNLPAFGQQYTLTSRLSFGDDFNLAAEAVGVSPTTGTFGVYLDLERDLFSQLFDGSIWSRGNIAQSWAEMTALDPQAQPAEPKRIDVTSTFVSGRTWINDSPDLGKYAYTGGATLRQAIEIPEQNDALVLVATGLTGSQTLTVGYTISFPDGALINEANRADVRSALTGTFILRAPTAAAPDRNRASFATILDDRYFEFNELVRIAFTYTPSGFTAGELIRTTNTVDYVIVNTDPELDRALVYYEFDTGTNATGPFTRAPTFVASPELSVSDWRHTSEHAFAVPPGAPAPPDAQASLDFEASETDYVDLGTAGPSFSAGDVITAEAWVRPESLSGIDYFLVAGPMALYVNGGTGRFGVTIAPATGTQFLGEFGTVANAVWTHVAVTFNAGAVAAFVNGASVATATATFTQLSSARRVIFGTQDPAGPSTNFFDGRLDEIRIWNVQRSASQIAANDTNAISPYTGGLVGYWQFDQNFDVEAIYDVTGTYRPAIPGNGELNQPVISSTVPTLTYVGNAPVASGSNGGLPQIQPETVPPGPNTDAATAARWGSGTNRTRIHLPFDHPGSTSSTVLDASPFGVDGTLLNKSPTQSQFVGGVHGSAIRFAPNPPGVKNGFNPVNVPVNATSAIQPTDDFAISFWARTADFSPATAADEVVFFAYQRNGNFLAIAVSTDEAVGGLVVEYSFGGNLEYTVPLADLANNSWHHFFIEIDGGSGAGGVLRVWVDGVVRPDSGIVPTDPAFPSLPQYTIGGMVLDTGGNVNRVVNGAMDDFAVLQGTRQASSSFTTADVLNIRDYGVAFAMSPLNGYQFTVGFQATSPTNLRLRIDALRFFDFADAAGGPTEWLLTVTDAANVNNLFARVRGQTTVGEWGGQYAELRNRVFSVRGPLLFTLYALNGTNGNWRIENVNLEGVVLNAAQNPPINAADDVVEARGNGFTDADVLANDTVNGTTVIDPDSILVGTPAGVTASVVGGRIRLTVDSTFAGEFELPYLIRDAGGNSAGAVVRVRVPDLPEADVDKTSAVPGTAHRVPVLLNDYDGVGSGLTVVVEDGLPGFPSNVIGSWSFNATTGELTLNVRSTAPLGPVKYTYRITDAHGRSDTAENDLTIIAALARPAAEQTGTPAPAAEVGDGSPEAAGDAFATAALPPLYPWRPTYATASHARAGNDEGPDPVLGEPLAILS